MEGLIGREVYFNRGCLAYSASKSAFTFGFLFRLLGRLLGRSCLLKLLAFCPTLGTIGNRNLVGKFGQGVRVHHNAVFIAASITCLPGLRIWLAHFGLSVNICFHFRALFLHWRRLFSFAQIHHHEAIPASKHGKQIFTMLDSNPGAPQCPIDIASKDKSRFLKHDRRPDVIPVIRKANITIVP